MDSSWKYELEEPTTVGGVVKAPPRAPSTESDKPRLRRLKPQSVPCGPLPVKERGRRATMDKLKTRMKAELMLAFTESMMLDNASLVVWTKGQMRGVRAAICRLKARGMFEWNQK